MKGTVFHVQFQQIYFIDVSSAWFLSLDNDSGDLHFTNWTSNKMLIQL